MAENLYSGLDDPKEIETYYGNMFEMFNCQGWKQLVEAFSQEREWVKNIETMNSGEELETRKGRLIVLNHILNLETVTHETYEHWLEESKNA